MHIEYRESFKKDILKIKEKFAKQKLKEKIFSIEKAKELTDITDLKKLSSHKKYFRIRIGNYRIGIKFENEIIILIRFLHRKDMYKYFPWIYNT